MRDLTAGIAGLSTDSHAGARLGRGGGRGSRGIRGGGHSLTPGLGAFGRRLPSGDQHPFGGRGGTRGGRPPHHGDGGVPGL
jgi:hypothetical protein